MDNLNDIIANLSPEDMNMLKGVAESILGPREKKGAEKQQENLPAAGPNPLGLSADDFNMMMKAKTIFDKMNSASNKNTDLILALKPHLSPENRNKADIAVKILKLFDVLPLLKDLF